MCGVRYGQAPCIFIVTGHMPEAPRYGYGQYRSQAVRVHYATNACFRKVGGARARSTAGRKEHKGEEAPSPLPLTAKRVCKDIADSGFVASRVCFIFAARLPAEAPLGHALIRHAHAGRLGDSWQRYCF